MATTTRRGRQARPESPQAAGDSLAVAPVHVPTNGTVAEAELPALTGPREPRILEWHALHAGADWEPGSGPEPMLLELWANFPNRLWLDLNPPTTYRKLTAALSRVALRHNGWLDPDGEPYPLLDGTEEAMQAFIVAISNRTLADIRECIGRARFNKGNFQPPPSMT